MIVKSHARRLRATLAKGPLMKEELRRVEGLGGQFVTLAISVVDSGEYAHTLDFTLDGVDYKVYSKVNNQR
jgi:hypothetical protein